MTGGGRRLPARADVLPTARRRPPSRSPLPRPRRRRSRRPPAAPARRRLGLPAPSGRRVRAGAEAAAAAAMHAAAMIRLRRPDRRRPRASARAPPSREVRQHPRRVAVGWEDRVPDPLHPPVAQQDGQAPQQRPVARGPVVLGTARSEAGSVRSRPGRAPCWHDPPVPGLSPDELLATTRSVRRRLDTSRPVERELIEECLRLAQQAPTGGNRQGATFVVVTDPASGAARWASSTGGAGPLPEEGILGAPPSRPTDPAKRRRAARIGRSASHLADHIAECRSSSSVPRGADRGPAGERTGRVLGSVLPAVWSFMLAARARGLGSAWTTLHLFTNGRSPRSWASRTRRSPRSPCSPWPTSPGRASSPGRGTPSRPSCAGTPGSALLPRANWPGRHRPVKRQLCQLARVRRPIGKGRRRA